MRNIDALISCCYGKCGCVGTLSGYIRTTLLKYHDEFIKSDYIDKKKLLEECVDDIKKAVIIWEKETDIEYTKGGI